MRHSISCIALALVLCGCAGTSNQSLGTGAGAVIGAVAGNQVGSGAGKALSTAGGAVLGGLIGNRIGKYLDDRGKQQAADATRKTAETGQPQQVRTSAGATVTTTPAPASASTATAAQQPVNPPAQSAARQCRTVRQTVVLQDGTRDSEDVTVCKGPDGWQPA